MTSLSEDCKDRQPHKRQKERKSMITDILNKINESIESKIEKDSYDNTVTLVVVFDEFMGMFSDKISDIEYLKSIFIELTKKEYIFKNVYILVDKYEGSSIVIEPRLIKLMFMIIV